MPTPPTSTRPWLAWPVLVAIVICIGFGFLGSRGLGEPDEGRYARVAVEMLERGDLLVPTLHGDRHLTKPPLTYWSIAAGVQVLGRNAWGFRLYLGFALVACALVLCRWGEAFVGGAGGRWAGLIFVSMPAVFVAASLATTDMLLLAFQTVGAWCLWNVWISRSSDSSDWWPTWAWLSFGLAFLTKGPPGLTLLLVFVAFAATVDATGKSRFFARLISPTGLLLFFVIGLGWYGAIAWLDEGALSYWLGTEIGDRLFGSQHGRNVQWYQPFKVYGPPLLLGSLPWTFLAFWLRKSDVMRLRTRPRAWLLLIWITLPLVIFSVSRSRQALYVLPLFPAFALAFAILLGRTQRSFGPAARAIGLVLLVVWCGGLLSVRALGDRLSPHRNARAIAESLASLAHERPVLVVERKLHAVTLYEPSLDLSLVRGTEFPVDDARSGLADALTQHPHAMILVHDKQLAETLNWLAGPENAPALGNQRPRCREQEKLLERWTLFACDKP